METIPTDNNAIVIAAELPGKRRKKKSVVWEHFTIETVGVGCRRACCKQCKQSFAYSTGSKVAGTSHLKRHIAKGSCPVLLRNQQNQFSPFSAPSKLGGSDPPKRRYRTLNPSYLGFDSERCRHEIARMIIVHEYPLQIVEHPIFINFVKNLQPRFEMVSFNTVQGDCVATYLREKQKLQNIIEGIPGRICLTLDMWNTRYSSGYVFLTAQFIDNEWKLHRKLLNFIMEIFPDSDLAFNHSIAACLADWNMEGRLFSVSINQPLTDTGMDNIRVLQSLKNPGMLGGQLLLSNCLARSLSETALEAFRVAESTVLKIRDCVKYVKTSESHEEKFFILKQQLQVPSSKTLAMDDISKWNTTYEMLISASEMKEVFACFDTIDPDFKFTPTMEEWKQVETICTYMKFLSDTANILASPNLQTTNAFFHEVWKIQLELCRASAVEDLFISDIAKAMRVPFDNYWKNCCLVLAIAVVMDPRFKMKLVEFSFSKIYGEGSAEYVKIVDDGIHELFYEYMTEDNVGVRVGGGGIKIEGSPTSMGVNDALGLTDFDVYIMETSSQQERSELDQYLEESLLPRVHEFDVLGWWKINKMKYPTLSKMARDILTIPVCTVGPESVFDTDRKELDDYKCRLRPETAEALICAKDWLKAEPVDIYNALVKMEFPI
ncbi:zinc finger BED domain-containing protein DAYSLEEPER-like [Impatiens glandulifera]|uniref:zinc finger BED domain-containing protein DAYSLEEPER-like n=1 Tax=Impatiens glandulifera TaxID=253017 RepID=UPI001FB0566E|nr:zinc finger BED domain-containing protein DAYSLEEPER-like [Impatiens glandulifera]